jgi:lipopolysaccharide transport system permease protein
MIQKLHAFIGLLSLAWRLFVLTIGAKYRKSFLGYFWIVAPALAITAGVTLANRAGIINAGVTALPYPVFVLIGTLIWYVFAEAMDVAHQAFEGARSYLTRVYFPRESIILARAFECVITALVRLALVLLTLIFFNGIDIIAFAWITLAFAGAVTLGLGIGALLMPFTMLFDDFQKLVKLGLSYGLFLTPAMYQPATPNGVFASLLKLNPVWPLMSAARDAAAGAAFSHANAFGIALIGGFVATLAGFVIVRAVAPIVIERMLIGGK